VPTPRVLRRIAGIVIVGGEPATVPLRRAVVVAAVSLAHAVDCRRAAAHLLLLRPGLAVAVSAPSPCRSLGRRTNIVLALTPRLLRGAAGSAVAFTLVVSYGSSGSVVVVVTVASTHRAPAPANVTACRRPVAHRLLLRDALAPESAGDTRTRRRGRANVCQRPPSQRLCNAQSRAVTRVVTAASTSSAAALDVTPSVVRHTMLSPVSHTRSSRYGGTIDTHRSPPPRVVHALADADTVL
jgi:hypothetical protein